MAIYDNLSITSFIGDKEVDRRCRFGKSFLYFSKSGPSCSKLTTSLVNDSLKFTSSDTQIC